MHKYSYSHSEGVLWTHSHLCFQSMPSLLIMKSCIWYFAIHKNHEIKRHLLHRGKAKTNPDNILKSRDITLSTKVQLVKAMVSPVFTYGCKS